MWNLRLPYAPQLINARTIRLGRLSLPDPMVLNFSSSWECNYCMRRRAMSPAEAFFMHNPLSLRRNTESRDFDLELHHQLFPPHLTALLRVTTSLLAFLTLPEDLKWYFNVVKKLIPVKSFARSGWFIRQWLANLTHSRRIGTWISLNLVRNKTLHYSNKNSTFTKAICSFLHNIKYFWKFFLCFQCIVTHIQHLQFHSIK